MKKAFINGFVFLCCCLAVLYPLQHIVDKGLKKSRMQYYATWNDIYGGKINADLLFCGESRAKLTYSPRILDSALGLNTFNLGINGARLPLQMARLKIYLQHNKKPRYIVQSVDLYLLSDMDHLIDYDQFLPYLDDTVLTNVMNRYKVRFTISEQYFPMFKYNNHINLVKEGINCYFNRGARGANTLYKGFAGVNFDFDNFFARDMARDEEPLKNSVDPAIAASFRDYVKFCRDNGIKLIFVYEPVMTEVSFLMQPASSRTTRTFMEFSKEYKVPFLTYYNDTAIGNHKELFIDHVHLRTAGAEAFSRQIAGDLKELLKTY